MSKADTIIDHFASMTRAMASNTIAGRDTKQAPLFWASWRKVEGGYCFTPTGYVLPRALANAVLQALHPGADIDA
jgi:hypothetical protein